MNGVISSFFNLNSFIGKFQVEKKNKNILIKSLFDSFFSCQDTELKNTRVLFQKKSKTGFFYIESLTKEIFETFLRMLRISTISLELIPCKKKLEKVFNEKSFYQILNLNDIIIFKPGTKKENLGIVKKLKNDFADVLFLKKNEEFYINKYHFFKEKQRTPSERVNNPLKTLKRDQIQKFAGTLKEFYKKKEKNFQQSQKNACSYSESYFQYQDILILNSEKNAKMVIAFPDNNIKLLSHNGSIQILNLEKLKGRLKNKNPRSSEGLDNGKNVILAGDCCEILSKTNKNKLFKVLFIQNNILFLKRLEKTLPQEIMFTVASGSDVTIVNKNEDYKKNQNEAFDSEVIIKKGIFKGYEGRVLQIGKKEIEIELKANGKLIKIPKKYIKT